MDKFIDKHGKTVLTINDDGSVKKDEKYFQDKSLAKTLTDKELLSEYKKRKEEGKLTKKEVTEVFSRLFEKGIVDDTTES